MTAEVLSLPRGGAAGPAPLVPAGINIRAVEGTMLDNYDMLDSDWISRLDLAERGAAMTLHLVAMKQQPSGSLPDDDVLLAGYLGFSVREVDLWLGMRSRVMNGWVLCSDGRLYHPYRAKNVLRLWIGWREANRRSALGNGTRSAEVRRGVRAIEADIGFAAEALRALDPADKFLDDLEVRMSKWTTRPRLVPEAVEEVAEAVTSSEPTVTAAVIPGATPLDGGQRLSQAKPGQILDPDLRSGFLGEAIIEGQEIEKGGGSVKRTPEWPPLPEARAQLRAAYPKWKSPGDVDRALATIRKGGKVQFAVILAGAHRVRDCVRDGSKDLKFVRDPARWLKARGWEDDPDPPCRDAVGSQGRAPPARPACEPSITQRAAMRAAERLGLLDEPRPRG